MARHLHAAISPETADLIRIGSLVYSSGIPATNALGLQASLLGTADWVNDFEAGDILNLTSTWEEWDNEITKRFRVTGHRFPLEDQYIVNGDVVRIGSLAYVAARASLEAAPTWTLADNPLGATCDKDYTADFTSTRCIQEIGAGKFVPGANWLKLAQQYAMSKYLGYNSYTGGVGGGQLGRPTNDDTPFVVGEATHVAIEDGYHGTPELTTESDLALLNVGWHDFHYWVFGGTWAGPTGFRRRFPARISTTATQAVPVYYDDTRIWTGSSYEKPSAIEVEDEDLAICGSLVYRATVADGYVSWALIDNPLGTQPRTLETRSIWRTVGGDGERAETANLAVAGDLYGRHLLEDLCAIYSALIVTHVSQTATPANTDWDNNTTGDGQGVATHAAGWATAQANITLSDTPAGTGGPPKILYWGDDNWAGGSGGFTASVRYVAGRAAAVRNEYTGAFGAFSALACSTRWFIWTTGPGFENEIVSGGQADDPWDVVVEAQNTYGVSAETCLVLSYCENCWASYEQTDASTDLEVYSRMWGITNADPENPTELPDACDEPMHLATSPLWPGDPGYPDPGSPHYGDHAPGPYWPPRTRPVRGVGSTVFFGVHRWDVAAGGEFKVKA